jgi:hypothetical protein
LLSKAVIQLKTSETLRRPFTIYLHYGERGWDDPASALDSEPDIFVEEKEE